MAGQNPGSPTDFQYFYEDEVYKINNRGEVVFGLVLENYEGNSSDQESDIETPIQKGEIRVVWHPSGVERVISEKTVGLADRSLMPGDVVRRLIAGKDTQRGYCRDIIMTAALQVVGTKHIIPAVASERLQPLEEFTSDLAVCLDSWVGTSKAVHSKLRLVAADGSRLEYADLDSCRLEDYSMRRRRDTRYSSPEFYPGQVLYGLSTAFENGKWVELNKDMKNSLKQKTHEHKLTVETVETQSVSVHWQCRALCTQANEHTPQQPKFLVEGEDLKNLKLLNVFEPCTLEVGDRNFLVIGPNDTFVNKKTWKTTQNSIYRKLRKMDRQPCKKVNSKCIYQDAPVKAKKSASKRKTHFDDNNDMDVDGLVEKIDTLDDTLKDVNCPSIKIEPSGEPSPPNTGSLEDTTTEEKNDSGISPEPAKEDSSHLNGDSKSSDIIVISSDDDNWENISSGGSEVSDGDGNGSDTDSGATWSSRCSSVASQHGKKSPQLAVKLLRGKRLKRTARKAPPAPPPKIGDKVIVETLHTTSVANVVWQDGTIEMGIPSTQLYPIHHLDGQECFPGDFVVGGTASNDENVQLKHREYGVVQRVDHHGRTAVVNWYRTYTSLDEPIPQFLSESEVSVYDLKDHPDFQYRPGTVVIRVANFTGEDANCTAGQVIDNFPSGRVKVWWVDGHTSMCWPQDLYKVGEYDSEDGELWASEASGSEDSWETQSSAEPPPQPPPIIPAIVKNEILKAVAELKMPAKRTTEEVKEVPGVLQPRVACHLERGRAAMIRLEQMFLKNPALQSQEIMRKLLILYKECRFLDRLMGTSFFHEDHFLGLLERVRERGSSTTSAGERRVHEQLTRLFTPTEEEKGIDFTKDNKACDLPTEDCSMEDPEVNETVSYGRAIIASNVHYENIDSELTAAQRRLHSHLFHTEAEDDSSDEGDDEPYEINNSKSDVAAKLQEIQSRNVCFKLCGLIHKQLLKAHAEVSRRRPCALAAFLNAFANLTHEEKLNYHFSVQYGALVVSKVDKDGEGSTANGLVSSGDLVSSGELVARNDIIADQYKCITDQVNSIADQVSLVTRQYSRHTPQMNYVCAQNAKLNMKVKNASSQNCDTANGDISMDDDNKNNEEGNNQEKNTDSQEDGKVHKANMDCQKDCIDNQDNDDQDSQVIKMDCQEDDPVNQEDVSNEIEEEKSKEEAPIEVPKSIPLTAPLAKAEVAEVEPTTPGYTIGGEGFYLLEQAPTHHRFRLTVLQLTEPKIFYNAVRREIKLLKRDLPAGVWVRGYEDRIDLLSIMIAGPKNTPYEGGLFLFDVQLGNDYPRAPPLCLYHSYCSDRLNPNLYEDGKVCVSLLGTWSGRGVEMWGKDSSLLQVIVSLQGLILNSEPYFNEAGYEKQKGTQQGNENSRMYNEMVLLKLVQSMTKLIMNPPEPFRTEVSQHMRENAEELCRRLEGWVAISNNQDTDVPPPEFPLVPASRGFCLSLRSSLDAFRVALRRNDINVSDSKL